VPMIV